MVVEEYWRKVLFIELYSDVTHTLVADIVKQFPIYNMLSASLT